jgi:hypothetical protein
VAGPVAHGSPFDVVGYVLHGCVRDRRETAPPGPSAASEFTLVPRRRALLRAMTFVAAALEAKGSIYGDTATLTGTGAASPSALDLASPSDTTTFSVPPKASRQRRLAHAYVTFLARPVVGVTAMIVFVLLTGWMGGYGITRLNEDFESKDLVLASNTCVVSTGLKRGCCFSSPTTPTPASTSSAPRSVGCFRSITSCRTTPSSARSRASGGGGSPAPCKSALSVAGGCA